MQVDGQWLRCSYLETRVERTEVGWLARRSDSPWVGYCPQIWVRQFGGVTRLFGRGREAVGAAFVGGCG
jgi:hypothetical protein